MTSLGRRQAVSQRLLVPSFHRFESCRPSRFKEFSVKCRELLIFLNPRKIIFGSHADKDLEDAFEKYAWNSEGQYSSWEYVSSQKISAFRSNGMDSEHRLYINTDPLDIYKVSMYLISKCVQRNIPYDFKFDEAGNRDDTIIIYTDTDHFLDFISILNEIEKEHPEIIANVKNPPLLSGKIGGWIGYGTEPKIPGKKTSFNEVRADAIEEAMNKSVTDWLEEHFIRLIAYNNNTVHVFEYVSAVVTDEILIGDKKINDSLWKYLPLYNPNFIKKYNYVLK